MVDADENVESGVHIAIFDREVSENGMKADDIVEAVENGVDDFGMGSEVGKVVAPVVNVVDVEDATDAEPEVVWVVGDFLFGFEFKVVFGGDVFGGVGFVVGKVEIEVFFGVVGSVAATGDPGARFLEV